MAQAGYTPIQLYRSTTPSAAPTAGNLADGELSINTADVALYAKNSSGAVKKIINNPAGLTYPITDGTVSQVLSTNGSGTLSWSTVVSTPGGSNTQIQFNNSGTFAGSANLTWDGSNLQVGSQGDLRLGDADNSNWLAFQAPATVPSNVTWTLPNADGTTGQVLSTNGSGTLSWAAASSVSPFSFNTTTVSQNYTFAAGQNAVSVGPITISSGFSVTVPSGQRWVVL